jgi:glycosyltransferase involved in cell wall biosynthesis
MTISMIVGWFKREFFGSAFVSNLPDRKLRVVHVLRNLNEAGLQLIVLNLIEELPSFAHTVIFQSEAIGPLHARFAGVADIEQCIYRGGQRLDFFRRLTKLLREKAPDVVVAHLFGNHTLVSWAAFLAGVRETYGVSANDPIHFSRSVWKPMALAHAARPFSRGEIAVSEAVGRILTSRLRLPARRVTVIPNGCRVEEIAARAEAGRRAAQPTSGNKRVFMAARITRGKDHPTALKAIQLLRSQGRDVELWLAGGAYRESFQASTESLTDELGIRDLVQFLGVRDDVPELMGASDIVIHSTNSEGFGMAVVEAMAAGVPVIATDIPACREILDGGRCGLLFPLGDAPALADAIRRLLDDEALRARLVQAASERVRSHYDLKRMAAGYAELFLAWSAPPGRAVAIGENQTGLGAVRGCIAK